jgi:hypothetical protein
MGMKMWGYFFEKRMNGGGGVLETSMMDGLSKSA